MDSTKKDLKKTNGRILSDSDVNRLYEKLEKEQQGISQSSEEAEMAGTKETTGTNEKKQEYKVFESMTEKATDIAEITQPTLNKIKQEVSDEMDDFVNESSEKIKSTSQSLKKIGSKYFERTKKEFEESEDYFKENMPEATSKIREGTSRLGSKTKNSFLDSIEKLYGASTVGKQYGQTSVQLLREVGELRKAGLITQKEYNEKKAELLDRI